MNVQNQWQGRRKSVIYVTNLVFRLQEIQSRRGYALFMPVTVYWVRNITESVFFESESGTAPLSYIEEYTLYIAQFPAPTNCNPDPNSDAELAIFTEKIQKIPVGLFTEYIV